MLDPVKACHRLINQNEWAMLRLVPFQQVCIQTTFTVGKNITEITPHLDTKSDSVTEEEYEDDRDEDHGSLLS